MKTNEPWGAHFTNQSQIYDLICTELWQTSEPQGEVHKTTISNKIISQIFYHSITELSPLVKDKIWLEKTPY